ncbi:MAG: calcium-binding protein [Geminicoccaceae bacterium]
MVKKVGDNDSNTLTGTDSDDQLFGLGGTDFLIGKKGNDLLDGGDGSDFAVYTNSATAVTVNLLLGKATGEGTDTLKSIENIDGSFKNDTINLDNRDNFANGNIGNDVIRGLGGKDTLFGGADNDKLFGGDGDDIINGQDGNDTVGGGLGTNDLSDDAGIDTLSYRDFANTSLEVSLASGTAKGVQVGAARVPVTTVLSDTFTGFENVDGCDKIDSIVGDSGNNVLKGFAGNDFISGNGGNDTVDGGKGNDELETSGGTTVLKGGPGNDVLTGSGVFDTYIPGTGRDVMNGLGGRDTFVFQSKADSVVGDQTDHIVDFVRREGDKIDVSGIDANEAVSGNQTFTFVTTITGRGQLAVVEIEPNHYRVDGNTTGDTMPDFSVELDYAELKPAKGDFIL